MKPWELLGEARTSDGTLLALTRRDREYVILANGKSLMSSLMHGSEEALATLACQHARTRSRPCVLVGGLGMGFTLRATLDVLPEGAVVVIAELLPTVVEWNRGPLGPLADHPLKDRRVTLVIGDVADTLKGSRDRFDAVLLDVDNGPDAFTATANQGLYGDAGLTAIRTALTRGGVVGVWSAREDRKFEQRLRYGGFEVEVVRVRARLKKGGPHHVIFLGRTALQGGTHAADARPGTKRGVDPRKRA
jgi:spermidine synthase